MAKRLTEREWKELEASFYKWCIKNGKYELSKFYRDGDYTFSFDRLKKRASAGEWRKHADQHLVRSGIAGAQEKFEEVQEKVEKANQVLVLSNMDESTRPEEATKIINECVKDGLDGFANGSKIFKHMSSITKKQLERMDKLDSAEGITMEEANAISTLVGATEKALKIFKQVAVVDSEQVKALVTLDEQYKLQAIEYKEQVRKEVKKDDKETIAFQGRLKGWQGKKRK